MPSKKANKTARKPVKASPKKAAPKPIASKKVAKSSSAAKPSSTPIKAPVKPVKVPAKAAVGKIAVQKPSKPKAPEAAPIKFDIRPLTSVPRPLGEEELENESAAASLLAGPRNVKPYIARRGEQYMNKEQLDHFARILQSWKRDLMVEVDRTVLHMKDEAANFPDPNDRATQEEEFSLELRTRDRERKLIRKIDEALKRIEDGTYGYCLETGEEIGIKRLEARPVATLSVEAQERRERREKQYGDRDDRYR